MSEGAHELPFDLLRDKRNDQGLVAGVFYVVLMCDGRAERRRIIVMP
jgi:hypothetical protein